MEYYDYLRESWIWVKNNFLSVILLLVVIYMMASGKLRKWLERIQRAKRIKAGVTGVDLEFGGMSEQSEKMFKTMWGKFDDVQSKLNEISGNINSLQEKNESIAQKQSGMFIDQLKLLFYNSQLNDEERLIAGLRYVCLGNNHQMKHDVIDFATDNPKLYRGACATKPAFRIPEVDKYLDINNLR